MLADLSFHAAHDPPLAALLMLAACVRVADAGLLAWREDRPGQTGRP